MPDELVRMWFAHRARLSPSYPCFVKSVRVRAANATVIPSKTATATRATRVIPNAGVVWIGLSAILIDVSLISWSSLVGVALEDRGRAPFQRDAPQSHPELGKRN